MDGPLIQEGTVLMKGDRIVGLGANVKIPLLAKKVQLQGKTVTPGLIDVFSALGGVGLGSGGGASPTRRAEDAFDRYDTANLVEALRNGVTSAYVSPGGPAGICGTGAVVRLALGQHQDGSFGQILKTEAALCIDLGSEGKPITRVKTLNAVRKQFRDALAYRRSLETYEEELAEYKKKLEEQQKAKSKKKTDDKEPPESKEKPKPSALAEEEKEKQEKEEGKEETAKKDEEDKPKKPKRPKRNPKLDVVLRALDHEMPVRISAPRSADILNALELAEEFSFDLILEGATEAYLVADQIADAEVPVILGRMDRSGAPGNDPYRRAIQNHGASLAEAGVTWGVGSGAESVTGARFIAMNAQLAAVNDPSGRALRHVTAHAADLLGVSDRIGRLRPGMLADLVIWSNDPADPAARVHMVYVGGDLVYDASDQGSGE
jgi:imidazolonepropionase-like amidohydrolase